MLEKDSTFAEILWLKKFYILRYLSSRAKIDEWEMKTRMLVKI